MEILIYLGGIVFRDSRGVPDDRGERGKSTVDVQG